MTRKLILSLDVGTPGEAREILTECRSYVDVVKIGSQLFLLGGAVMIQEIHDMGKEVFLDLKFHDIPTTVARAACRAVDLGVLMFNVHTSGGSGMMKTVVEEVNRYTQHTGKRRPYILGVTILTSIDQKTLRQDFHCRRSLPELVVLLAGLAQKSGMDGVVASPEEILRIKKTCGKKFLVVVPGIRTTQEKNTHDQKRTASPSAAIRAGADYIVVGRSILEARDKRSALKGITQEIRDAEEHP